LSHHWRHFIRNCSDNKCTRIKSRQYETGRGISFRYTPLLAADTLLLYTDGLIERRAASISDALAEFAAAAVPAGPDADSHAARILASAASDTGDDACLLAVRIL
jgi:hypothetical protein